ncbi:MAG: GDSL-type esterase/lipase family protein [Bacteroidetes bacterium]|nr:GDSL-type esterase/lipase family protein [Bacteroidota bacterium]
MPKNYISNVFSFLLIIIAIFGILSLIEDYRFAKNIKPFNIFSDIISQPETITGDTIKIPVVEATYPCPDSIQCFENYTEIKYPLDSLITKLLSKDKQVRVAWFGDSFTEADIVVGNLRDTLQSLYGGNGVGFMPITFEATGFRRTVIHHFNGWHTRSFISNPRLKDYGIGGTIYKPDSAAFVAYEGTAKFFKHTQNFGKLRLFYTSENESSVSIRLNGGQSQSYSIRQTALPKQVVVATPDIWRVSIYIPDTLGNTAFYGASLEDTTGIYFDNFAIKGNSGLGLLTVREDFLKQFNDMLHYDLIVLQFGLNVAEATRTDYSAYAKSMTKVIEKLKNAFPDVPILILSVSDRSRRVQGEYVTMAGIPALLEAQRTLAADNQIIFWNLFEAMGGMNSMAAFVDAKPPLANKDYTHLNFAGSKKVALKFAESFIHEVDIYKKRKEKEE